MANVNSRCFVPRLPVPHFNRRRVAARASSRRLGLAICFCIAASSIAGLKADATPINLNLNRPLQFGWYSLRVQNPFGTIYTGIIAIKSYNPATKEFLFLDKDGKDVIIKESDISFIYFRQLPDRNDVNVKTGDVRNIQITPFKEFLYEIGPGRMAIQDGVLLMNRRWRIATQTPFDTQTTPPSTEGGGRIEQIEIPRRIQIGYFGDRYLVETELVNVLLNDTPQPDAGTVPRAIPNPFKNPPPTMAPMP